MLPTTGSVMIAARASPLGEEPLHRGEVVPGERERVLREVGGHAGRVGQAERLDARARLHEQRVARAVVAAVELEDVVAAGEAAREPDRGGRRLGARRDEAHLLDPGHPLADELAHPDLARRRRAEGRPPSRSASCTACITAEWQWPRMSGPHEPT